MQEKIASFRGLILARAVGCSKQQTLQKFRRKFSRGARVIFQVRVPPFRFSN